MFNIKRELDLDVNIKLGLINLKFNFQGLLESRMDLDADVELGPVIYSLTWKSF